MCSDQGLCAGDRSAAGESTAQHHVRRDCPSGPRTASAATAPADALNPRPACGDLSVVPADVNSHSAALVAVAPHGPVQGGPPGDRRDGDGERPRWAGGGRPGPDPQ
jgi:hypothetical protein